MAPSANSPAPPPSWTARLHPDEVLVHEARYSLPSSTTELAACGLEWDAVAVTPLERGLSALDVLGLPVDAGVPVLADYVRGELVVLVAPGTGGAAADVPGVRVLAAGAWLLLPVRGQGAMAAAWLSAPDPQRPKYGDVTALREALLRTDADRVDRSERTFHAMLRRPGVEASTARPVGSRPLVGT
ncbi:hypothetical protein ACFV1L_22175 [Kitasatospora sp. NPDC059646]|uniref:hypothetical protein n=1 Tax=Kitasatospora sp. NPDC059646 TaxID=3346893 RepID=UPI0036B640AD